MTADTPKPGFRMNFCAAGLDSLTKGEGGLVDLVWFVLASNQIRPDGEIELDEKRDCDNYVSPSCKETLDKCPLLLAKSSKAPSLVQELSPFGLTRAT